MNWTKYAVLTLILVLEFVVGIFCSHFGWAVDGIPQGGDIGSTPSYLWDMAKFNIDGMPAMFSFIFDLINIVIVTLALSWIRGTD